MYRKQKRAKDYLLNKGFGEAKIGLVLNPVYKDIFKKIEVINEVPYKNIPGFPVDFNHEAVGNFVYAKWDGVPILMMDRALQYYKGFKANEIIFPIRLMTLLGVETILASNFCGSVNPAMEEGSLMLNEDYINMISDNPFIGQKDDFPGPRFLDMNEPYSIELIHKIRRIANHNHIKIYQGTYVNTSGPSFPTPSEYRFYKTIGADVVGTSGVFECMAARQVGCTFASISIITENCDPYKPDPKSSERMLETVNENEEKYFKLLNLVIQQL